MGQPAKELRPQPFELGQVPGSLPRLSSAEIAIIGGDDPLQALFRDSALASATLSQLQPARRSLRAAAELGTDTLRSAALLAAADHRVFAVPGYARGFSRLRRHSIAVAHLTEIVAAHAGFHEPGAFMAGLFHDLAPAAIAVGLGMRDQAALEHEWPSLLAASADAAWLMAEIWLLPNAVREGIDTFHREAPEYDDLGAALTVADALALELVEHRRDRSLSLIGPSPAVDLALDVLGLYGEAYDALVHSSRAHLESVADVAVKPLERS